MYTIFIDGSSGTTGLRITSLLAERDDIEITELTGEARKDEDARLAQIRAADVSVLCLPDTESAKIAARAPTDARLIDASTVHRVDPAWVYGLPELGAAQRERIAGANRVAVPGCHATGFILLARPLVESGIVRKGHPFIAHSVTGYSGGGKAMIAEYESAGRAAEFSAPRQYALGQRHKHLPEMKKYALCEREPVFTPHVADYFSGIEVVTGLFREQLADGAGASDVRAALEDYYAKEDFITVRREGAVPGDGYLSAAAYAGRNDVEISINGNEERITLTARYDNLGKGAAGAAVQCLNSMLGIDEKKGLLD
ncbi:MAG: N-acetyl-gamma-glutamyl-phosphate reductase [Clostridiales Family XIII bacterium]|jgi:N-acetyl-gamma-glutamyl-phosphate reductase|nr:N-acetyl-gamma-glutamyl-phosphate reductase [Clostridiales Family XIII bacterium]